MKSIRVFCLTLVIVFGCLSGSAQTFSVTSPDKKISVSIENSDKLTYSVSFNDRIIVNPSRLGFELKDEANMDGNFSVVTQNTEAIKESWIPVVKSKHAEILNHYQELKLELKEKSGLLRRMDLLIRAYNDGIAFRYKLYRAEKPGNRKITRELTTFNIPSGPKAWIVEYGGYSTSNESEFFEHGISYLSDGGVVSDFHQEGL